VVISAPQFQARSGKFRETRRRRRLSPRTNTKRIDLTSGPRGCENYGARGWVLRQWREWYDRSSRRPVDILDLPCWSRGRLAPGFRRGTIGGRHRGVDTIPIFGVVAASTLLPRGDDRSRRGSVARGVARLAWLEKGRGFRRLVVLVVVSFFRPGAALRSFTLFLAALFAAFFPRLLDSRLGARPGHERTLAENGPRRQARVLDGGRILAARFLQPLFSQEDATKKAVEIKFACHDWRLRAFFSCGKPHDSHASRFHSGARRTFTRP
jgi:hypothetical protein